MKTLVLIVTILSCSYGMAQTPCNDTSGNWNLTSGNCHLQYIYFPNSSDSTLKDSAIFKDSAQLFATILRQCKTIIGAEDVHILDGSIEFTVKGHHLDYKSQGYSYMEVPVLVLHPMNFNVSIDFKNGKYRVLVSNLVTIVPGAYGTQSPTSWNTFLFNKKGCIRDFGKANLMLALEMADKDIRGLFRYKRAVGKSDW